MDDKDLWRAAKVVTEQYGADAAGHAALRADQFIEAGDAEGVYVWEWVLKAIEELQTAGPGTRH